MQKLQWRKATASNPSGNCVELASWGSGPSAAILMRNSRYPGILPLAFTRAEIAAFLDGAKAGEFDDLA